MSGILPWNSEKDNEKESTQVEVLEQTSCGNYCWSGNKPVRIPEYWLLIRFVVHLYNQLSSCVQEKALTDQNGVLQKVKFPFSFMSSQKKDNVGLGGQTLMVIVFLKTAHGGREGEKQCFNERTPPGAAKWSINKLPITVTTNGSRFHANSKYWVSCFHWIHYCTQLNWNVALHF